MCTNCGVNANACFNDFCQHGLSDAEKTDIVDKHNELRSLVANGNQAKQPTASNMNKLQWDDELAKVAQMWVDQCPQGHDSNRYTCQNKILKIYPDITLITYIALK
jgi:hypothetical protein